MNRLALVCAGVVAIAVGYVVAVDTPAPHAADHGDSPSLAASPLADINDLYAWMVGEDGRDPVGPSHLALAMTVHRNYPDASAVFDATATYRFHIAAIDDTQDPAVTTDYTVSCTFVGTGVGAPQTHVCQLAGGGDVTTATGDNDVVAGEAEDDFRVFAGVRDDPFFFNLTGFVETVSIVNAAAGDLTFNQEGCPTLTDGTAEALVGCLTTKCDNDGSPAENDFAGENVLAIVATIAKTALTAGGEPATKFHVWASTHDATGAQLDRMGRPAINTALINPFGLIADDGALKNAYNASDDPDDWGDFADEIKKNLAILDALDSTGPAE